MKIGIYCILNKINNKRYIGKSINIERRFIVHRYELTKGRNKKHFNRYLKASVTKYGIENFEFIILETISEIDEETLSNLELKWIDYYNTLDKNNGYNLRYDSSTGMITHELTLNLMSKNQKGIRNSNYGKKWTDYQKAKASEIQKRRHSEGKYGQEWRDKLSETNKKIWLDDDKRSKMAEKVSKSKTIYDIIQYTKDMVFVKKHESVNSVILENPSYKWQNIYSVCNGYKKSYMGYIWEKQLKI